MATPRVLILTSTSISERLVDAVRNQHGLAAADELCAVCVETLSIDDAVLSLVLSGTNSGTFGASGARARTFGEVQFALGEGPCLDAVTTRSVVVAPELAAEFRWLAYTSTMLGHNVHSVSAIPVVLGGQYIGALDVFRREPGPVTAEEMGALLMAAELAQMPLLDLLTADELITPNAEDTGNLQAGSESDVWSELSSLSRTEVNQATGMLVAQLGIAPAEALVRLRAHAFATGSSPNDTARDILEHRVRLAFDR